MKPPTASEKRHMARVAEMPCLVCGARPVTLHHPTGFADRMGRFSRSHKLVTPLCPMHHLIQHDPFADMPISVERLGHRGFYREHGIDLLAEAARLWAESFELERRAA